jgi:hypothetical protein
MKVQTHAEDGQLHADILANLAATTLSHRRQGKRGEPS